MWSLMVKQVSWCLLERPWRCGRPCKACWTIVSGESIWERRPQCERQHFGQQQSFHSSKKSIKNFWEDVQQRCAHWLELEAGRMTPPPLPTIKQNTMPLAALDEAVTRHTRQRGVLAM